MKEFELIKAALKKCVIMHGARINFLACFIVYSARLGDKRLTPRLVKIAGNKSRNPGASYL